MEANGFELDKITLPDIKSYPPAGEYDYCKEVLAELDKIPGEKNERSKWEKERIGLLCGMLESIFGLGYRKGVEETRGIVTRNLFRRD